MTFKDHFSGHARDYAESRPTYPPDLFAYLADLAPGRELAWDCGTGNGQAAVGLAPHFRRVVATDASRRQVAEAPHDDRISYLVAPAERAPLPDASVDLITVALALHWFDLAAYYDEVRRVARPGGVLACWFYNLQQVSPEVDAVVVRLFRDVLGPYWPPEIGHIAAGYRTIPFPFDRIEPPPFRMSRRWDLAGFLDYMGTWSAARRYRDQTGADPFDAVRADLETAWGDPSLEREAAWPLQLLVGRARPAV
jgi:SAM-dependent methyltransferase